MILGLSLHFAQFKVSILLHIKVGILLHIRVGINDLTDVDLIPLARAANSLRGWQLSSYNGLSLYTIVKIITSLCAIVKIIPSYTPSSGSSRWLGLSYSLFIRHRQDHPLIICHHQDHHVPSFCAIVKMIKIITSPHYT